MTAMHNDEGKNVLLDPRFLIYCALLLASMAGIYWKLQIQGDRNTTDIADMRRDFFQTLDKIEAKLPNREADELRFSNLKDEVARNKSEVDFSIAKLEKWQAETTLQLIKKGIL